MTHAQPSYSPSKFAINTCTHPYYSENMSFWAVCIYYWQTLRGCSSVVHELHSTKHLQKFSIFVDHPVLSLIFHYVHVHAHNKCTSTPYRCMHIVCMHMH